MTDRRITELHLWAVREGLRRAPAATLFEDFCRRLAAAGLPLWRAFVGMRTLHPQWAGYTYTWWRDRDLVHPVRRVRGEEYDQDLRDSPYLYLLNAAGSGDLPLRLRASAGRWRRATRFSNSRGMWACTMILSLAATPARLTMRLNPFRREWRAAL
jgi:hypothetical protein